MTTNIGSAKPGPFSGAARQAAREAREAKRRQHVVAFAILAAAARTALDKRTLAGAIVVALGVAAAASLATERGMPGLDWYLARGADKNRRSA